MKSSRLLPCLNIALLISAGVVGGIAFWPISPVRESARRSVASSNLRQIGQASLVYAAGNQNKLPAAENIWDYASELARVGGLNDATIWTTGTDDPANVDALSGLSTVLTADRRGVKSEFRNLALSWAVPLGQLDASMPSTVPIGWTRGLRPDGTWSAHSPYGAEGGHIVFLGGNVVFYRNMRDALHRYDGTGKTSNILEALPPGTRIGEYAPSRREQTKWVWNRRMMNFESTVGRLTVATLWLLALVALSVQVIRKRWPAWSLVWFLVLSFTGAIVCA